MASTPTPSNTSAPVAHSYPADFFLASVPRAEPKKSRRFIHLLLLLATAATASVSGAWFWMESFEGLSDLWRQPSLALAGWPYALALLAILGAHEMGHYFACRKYRIPATLPFFLPGLPPFGTFGAVIRIRAPLPDRVALFDVAAAGPIAGFAVALPIMVIGLLQAVPMTSLPSAGEVQLGSPLVSSLLEALLFPVGVTIRPGALYGAGWVGMLVTSMNLFPVGQLDGGHAAYAVSRRFHRVLARATIAGVFALVVWQAIVLNTIPAYALWLVVLFFMRDRHPRLTDETIPLGAGRKVIAMLLALLFLATFIPIPLMVL